MGFVKTGWFWVTLTGVMVLSVFLSFTSNATNYMDSCPSRVGGTAAFYMFFLSFYVIFLFLYVLAFGNISLLTPAIIAVVAAMYYA